MKFPKPGMKCPTQSSTENVRLSRRTLIQNPPTSYPSPPIYVLTPSIINDRPAKIPHGSLLHPTNKLCARIQQYQHRTARWESSPSSVHPTLATASSNLPHSEAHPDVTTQKVCKLRRIWDPEDLWRRLS